MPDGDSLIAPVGENSRSAAASCKASIIPAASCIASPMISRTTTADLDVTHDGKILAAIQRAAPPISGPRPAPIRRRPARSLQANRPTIGRARPLRQVAGRSEDGDVWLMNPDGAGRTVLVSAGAQPDFACLILRRPVCGVRFVS